MKTPVAVTYSGDLVRAGLLRGRATKEMHILETYMAFQGLQQAVRKVAFSKSQVSQEAGTIVASVEFGHRRVHIHVPPRGGGEGDYSEACLCNCNFSVGWILEEQEETVDYAKLYRVKACYRKKTYKVYENVLASDWAEYKPGQKVILMPYHMMEYSCCTIEMGAQGCTPIRYGVNAEENLDDENWRTIYRILPWNADAIPKIINVKRSEDGPVR